MSVFRSVVIERKMLIFCDLRLCGEQKETADPSPSTKGPWHEFETCAGKNMEVFVK